MPNEFDLWLEAVDYELKDRDEARAKLPYQLHQWWELWDHSLTPEDAVIAALMLLPGANAPWPAPAAYSTN